MKKLSDIIKTVSSKANMNDPKPITKEETDFRVGQMVSFKRDDETFLGKIVELKGFLAVVSTRFTRYYVPYEQLNHFTLPNLSDYARLQINTILELGNDTPQLSNKQLETYCDYMNHLFKQTDEPDRETKVKASTILYNHLNSGEITDQSKEEYQLNLYFCFCPPDREHDPYTNEEFQTELDEKFSYLSFNQIDHLSYISLMLFINYNG